MRFRRLMAEAVWLLLAYLLFIIFLFTTNPQNLPVGILVLPFIWLFFLQYLSVKLVLRVLGPHLIGRLYRKRSLAALLVSIFSTLLLTLQSINQLSFGDVFVISALVLAFLFYMSRINLRSGR